MKQRKRCRCCGAKRHLPDCPRHGARLTPKRKASDGSSGPVSTGRSAGYLVFVSDLSKHSDRIVARRSTRQYAVKLAALRNQEAIAANGGEPFYASGLPVPLYYVMSAQSEADRVSLELAGAEA